jgi:hypothetical protein
MAILMKADGSSIVALAAHVLVGRSPVCTLRLDDPQASSEHARLSFAGEVWSVRDLGSKNGTWLNGVRLEPGGTRPLASGDRLAFGNTGAVWMLSDASPPAAMARGLAAGEMIAARDGMLALPSADAPVACVFQAHDGGWVADVEGEEHAARDGEVLHAGGVAFMLHLPVVSAATVDVRDRRPGLEDVELSFRVSQDEEHVEVTVLGLGDPRIIPPRAHHYTLLTIARARLRDRGAPGLSESQRGWVFVDELCRSLPMEEGRLNVEIYRIRQEFAALGPVNATGVIERRRGSRQLRLGTERLVIATMG